MSDFVEVEMDSVVFYSHIDEEIFFKRIEGLESVRKIQGQGTVLYVTVDRGDVSRDEFEEFVAIFRRYVVPLGELSKLDNPRISKWLRSKNFYWKEEIIPMSK